MNETDPRDRRPQRIAVLPGDGIGQDVTAEAVKVLEAARERWSLPIELVEKPWSADHYLTTGESLPDGALEDLRDNYSAILVGAYGDPRIPDMRHAADILLGLRFKLDLFINFRPIKIYDPRLLPLKDKEPEDVDFVVFRENTEGMYGGVEFHPIPQNVFDALCTNPKMKKFGDKGLENLALSTRIMSRQGCESIMRASFQYATTHHRKSVTLVEKPNVLRETGGLITRVAREVSADYPDIPLWEANIDAMCMWLVKKPQEYDVLVAENMFGDIISDLAAGLVGGLGFASSANIGDDYAVFEPTHGSAPKYAGQYRVNPMAMLLTVKLMFDWLGETDCAKWLERAIATVIQEGTVGTSDVGGTSSTIEVAEEVARKINATTAANV